MKNQVIISVSLLLLVMLFLPLRTHAEPVLPGDVDGNGIVDIEDVTVLIGQLLDNSDALSQPAADVNGDGCVDVGDVTQLIDKVLLPQTPVEMVTVTVNGVSFNMVLVHGGTFAMGCTPDQDPEARRNESPVHKVTLATYYIAQTEVTQELWIAVTGGNPSLCQGNLQCPVENVTQFDCAKYVDFLTEMTGKAFRLPTEAEWEFAARGGNLSRGYRFAGNDDIDQVAWYVDNAGGVTHPVGTKAPNELGLYDMSGNVFEWCQDFYSGYDEAPQINPVGPESGYNNIIRGGCWDYYATFSRVPYRGTMLPGESSGNVGLRVVMNY